MPLALAFALQLGICLSVAQTLNFLLQLGHSFLSSYASRPPPPKLSVAPLVERIAARNQSLFYRHLVLLLLIGLDDWTFFDIEGWNTLLLVTVYCFREMSGSLISTVPSPSSTVFDWNFTLLYPFKCFYPASSSFSSPLT